MGKAPDKKLAGTVAETPFIDLEDASARVEDAVLRQLKKELAAGLKPGLYIVATPIGHLSDITLRAISILAKADMVFCEDTRHSRKLLFNYGIRRKLDTYHDFSSENDRKRILGHIKAGKSIALISDAGTPLIADPGYKLVREARNAGFGVSAIPGPCAAISALVSSGLPTDQFFFGGFLPPKEAGRRAALETLMRLPGTLILYETAPRLADTLAAIAGIDSQRAVTIARELTKLHEEVVAATPGQSLDGLKPAMPKGEIVLLIGPAAASAPAFEDIKTALAGAMRTLTLREAVEEVTKGLGVSRKEVYNLALQMRAKNDRAT